MSDEILMKLQLENPNEAVALFGVSDSHLKLLETELSVSIVTRGEELLVSGKDEEVRLTVEIADQLVAIIRKGINISSRDVLYAIEMGKQGTLEYLQTYIKKKSQRMPRVNQSGSRPLVNDNISKQSGRKILSSASALPVQGRPISQ